MVPRRSPDQQLMVDLDETALLAHVDTVARRALRTWADEAIDRLEEDHDLRAERDSVGSPRY
ncbi:hypothetical protein ACIBBE_46995 [Streptomyces sp. NPDC051644]|uniref:hypothetical protein n=1 Tax=Streptomyces sp. NPDC051644 TaxID=3365666 RepID=UPI0037BA413A